MISKHAYLIAFLVWFGGIGCFSADHIEFEDAFELTSFLTTHIRELPGKNIRFQILTRQGEPVPFGVLRFQWVEGGRMSFQADPRGWLHIEFEKDILDYEVMVSAETKGTKIRVTW